MYMYNTKHTVLTLILAFFSPSLSLPPSPLSLPLSLSLPPSFPPSLPLYLPPPSLLPSLSPSLLSLSLFIFPPFSSYCSCSSSDCICFFSSSISAKSLAISLSSSFFSLPDSLFWITGNKKIQICYHQSCTCTCKSIQGFPQNILSILCFSTNFMQTH